MRKDASKAAPPPVIEQELGMLEVSAQVFRDVASRTLSQVKGVAVVGRAAGGLFRRGARTEVVGVERGRGEVAFSVHLTVCYDVCIPDLMRELHKHLTADVETATGYKIRTVNVTIDHILPPVPARPAADGPVPDNIPDLPPVPDQE